MSLRLVYGRAGSGKSYFCMGEIQGLLKEGAKDPLILLVPEQYSLQAERNLISIAPAGGVINATVLSFRRMAYRVFNELGGFVGRHITSSGKSMLIYRIVEELKDSFD